MVGIIVFWNYFYFLVFDLVIVVFVVGNWVMIKMFEYIFYVVEVLCFMLVEVFLEDWVVVIIGEVDVGIVFFKLLFDYLFFIGFIVVGKYVMVVVVENLMFVILELGGKFFVVIYEFFLLEIVVECILWGKCINVG